MGGLPCGLVAADRAHGWSPVVGCCSLRVAAPCGVMPLRAAAPCGGTWPQPAAPLEIVYPCIPDPDGEDEVGHASSSLAVSTR
ncbi:hypothetical protein B296_00042493 [Ensete ventricosum]|uniref:Uncharacterized protein n=1 Tax=Ensete ventricosum TaxID=4639 RepID=A0A426XW07_ENSVE|nr:hypothetical protein B296_00042493 [Ensete ventricosum]